VGCYGAKRRGLEGGVGGHTAAALTVTFSHIMGQTPPEPSACFQRIPWYLGFAVRCVAGLGSCRGKGDSGRVERGTRYELGPPCPADPHSQRRSALMAHKPLVAWNLARQGGPQPQTTITAAHAKQRVSDTYQPFEKAPG